MTRFITTLQSHRSLSTKLLAVVFILAVAFAVRGLTTRFIRDHLSDASWFQYGSYELFDRQAQQIIDGKTSLFWIDDPSQTEIAVYPPGYPIWLALVYKLSGNRSALAVQNVQWILDALAVLLILGIGVSAYNWATGLFAGLLAALAPLLALAGATPSADAPTNWIVLAGVWLLVLAYKRNSLRLALTAGVAIGVSCWFRANGLFLVGFWAIALIFVSNVNWRRRVLFAAAPALGAVVLVTPLLVRNAVAFHAFVPTGLGVGTNLWEGLGETDRAVEFGAVYGDQALIEQERTALQIPADERFTLYYPDGVQRDRARARKAFAVIARHPFWYGRVMLGRMGNMFKYAGDPPPRMGSSGINVTSQKTLPSHLQGGVTAALTDALGMVQSVMRVVWLPMALAGICLTFWRAKTTTALLLGTALYYLLSLSFLHSELRYGLPMHSLMLVWAGFTLMELRHQLAKRFART